MTAFQDTVPDTRRQNTVRQGYQEVSYHLSEKNIQALLLTVSAYQDFLHNKNKKLCLWQFRACMNLQVLFFHHHTQRILLMRQYSVSGRYRVFRWLFLQVF